MPANVPIMQKMNRFVVFGGNEQDDFGWGKTLATYAFIVLVCLVSRRRDCGSKRKPN
jgi:hypothetical protein